MTIEEKLNELVVISSYCAKLCRGLLERGDMTVEVFNEWWEKGLSKTIAYIKYRKTPAYQEDFKRRVEAAIKFFENSFVDYYGDEEEEADTNNDGLQEIEGRVFYSSRHDTIAIQQLSNEDKEKCEERILGGKIPGISKDNDNKVVRYSDVLDLRVVDLETITGESSENGVNPLLYEVSCNTQTLALKIDQNRSNMDGFSLTDDVRNKGIGVGMLLSASPFNGKPWGEIATVDSSTLEYLVRDGKDINTSFIQVPVPKNFKDKERAVKECDYARYVFFTGSTMDPDFLSKSDLYEENSGTDLNGCEFWYKGVDNIPSAIRPMSLNNLIQTTMDISYNPKLRILKPDEIGGIGLGMKDVLTHKEYKDCRLTQSDGFHQHFNLSRFNKKEKIAKPNYDLYLKLLKAYSNKIIVVEHKRVNTTVELRNGRLEVTCPIARSLIDSGYTIDISDREMFTKAYENFYSNKPAAFIPLTFRDDETMAIMNSAFDFSRGEFWAKRPGYGKTVPLKGWVGSTAVANVLAQKDLESRNGDLVNFTLSTFTSVRAHDIRRDTGCKYASPLFNGEDVVLEPLTRFSSCPGRWRPGESDYHDDFDYSYGKYEVPVLWIPKQGKPKELFMGNTVNLSITFTKNTIIDILDPSFLANDVVYDRSSKLLIGRISKDTKETLRTLENYHHPLSLNTQRHSTDGYTFEFVRKTGSDLPKKLYMSVLGAVEILKPQKQIGEEGIYVYKDGKLVKKLLPNEMKYFGIFNTLEEANEYNSFGKYYKATINQHNSEMKEILEARSLNKQNLKLAGEERSLYNKLYVLEQEGNLSKVQYELENLKLHLTKLKTDLSIIEHQNKLKAEKLALDQLSTKALNNGLDTTKILMKGVEMIGTMLR